MYRIETPFESPPFNQYPLTTEEIELLLDVEQDGEVHWDNLAQHQSILDKIRPSIASIIKSEGWVTLHD
ncbi:hypothetical protein NG798_27250 [Ancylothrix sp. C2]|uniref:hypothetical protein n=1 Tax=Ancylothrix sp. D3o TaxID=2953691 RepID=UPI0021BADD1F|nr:hypothetical protein [Ancylothrix sp. D3o]MCT7953497.1 hypothetical protein [Ancylothrix sp. D3o]